MRVFFWKKNGDSSPFRNREVFQMIERRPLSEEQQRKLKERERPSATDIQQAQDALFMYLLAKVEELERKAGE